MLPLVAFLFFLWIFFILLQIKWEHPAQSVDFLIVVLLEFINDSILAHSFSVAE